MFTSSTNVFSLCYVPLKDHEYTEPVFSGHSKIDKIKILMTNGSLLKVESIAECSPWIILQFFDMH